MVKIVPTPDWFLGADVFIQLFSFIVLFIFSFLSIKNYKISKNRRFLYLGFGFILIGLAQLADLLTKLVLYYHIGPSLGLRQIGETLISSHIVNSVDIFYYIGFFFNRFLTLCGLFAIYRLPRVQKSIEDYILVLYFVLLSAFVSEEFYYIYYITTFIFLALIIRNYYFVYQENRFSNTKVLIAAFSMLALSQLIFIFSGLSILFVLADTVGLVSYLILLILIIRISQNGKETNRHGHNSRYVGSNPRKKSRD